MNPDDQIKQQMFYAACVFVLFVMAYCFVCAFHKPEVDLTTPLFGLAMMLVGYYWGTGKTSGDKDKTISKQIDNAQVLSVKAAVADSEKTITETK